MRVLQIHPAPGFSVADVHHGWLEAFRQLGCTTVGFNLNDRLDFYAAAHLERDGKFIPAFDTDGAVRLAAKGIEAAAFELWPDLVVIISGFFVPADTIAALRRRGMKVVLICTEEPYEATREMTQAALVDACVINDPTNLESFRAVNPNTWYIPAAHDPAIHCPGPAQPGMGSDFCFVGTGYQSRIDYLEAVDWTGIDVALAGNWQALTDTSPLRKFVAHDLDVCCPNEEAVDLYRSAKVSANLYRVEAEQPALSAGWSMGPREVELAATGTFFVRQPRGEGDLLFPMLPVVHDPAELGATLRFYLARPDLAADLAAEARAAVADRTFKSNAEQLLRLLEA